MWVLPHLHSMKVLVEFHTEPQLSKGMNRAARNEELERVAKAARNEFALFLKDLRQIDPNLQDADAPMMPVMVITATDAAIQHLRENRPNIVKNIKDLSRSDLSIPPGEE